MCCLFGLIDYGHSLTGWEKNQMLSVLASACEVARPENSFPQYSHLPTMLFSLLISSIFPPP